MKILRWPSAVLASRRMQRSDCGRSCGFALSSIRQGRDCCRKGFATQWLLLLILSMFHASWISHKFTTFRLQVLPDRSEFSSGILFWDFHQLPCFWGSNQWRAEDYWPNPRVSRADRSGCLALPVWLYDHWRIQGWNLRMLGQIWRFPGRNMVYVYQLRCSPRSMGFSLGRRPLCIVSRGSRQEALTTRGIVWHSEL